MEYRNLYKDIIRLLQGQFDQAKAKEIG